MLSLIKVVMNEFQAKDNAVFGRHDGSNRVFALQDIALSLGLMVGPFLSGTLSQAVGYYWMSVAFGERPCLQVLYIISH